MLFALKTMFVYIGTVFLIKWLVMLVDVILSKLFKWEARLSDNSFLIAFSSIIILFFVVIDMNTVEIERKIPIEKVNSMEQSLVLTMDFDGQPNIIAVAMNNKNIKITNSNDGYITYQFSREIPIVESNRLTTLYRIGSSDKINKLSDEEFIKSSKIKEIKLSKNDLQNKKTTEEN